MLKVSHRQKYVCVIMPSAMLQEGSANRAKKQEKITLLLEEALNLSRQDPDRALQLAEQALEQSREADKLNLSSCLYHCAERHYDLSHYEGSLGYAREALELFQGLSETVAVIDTLDVLGRSHEKLGKYPEAITYHERALALSREQKDVARVGKSLTNLGIVHYDQSDYRTAILHYLEAFEVLEDVYWQGRVLGCLGNAFERMGEYAKALEYHQQCLQRFSQEPYLRERSFALNNIANVYIVLGEFAKAITYHEQSLTLKRQMRDTWGEGSSLQNLGVCYLQLHDLERAECYFRESLPIVEAIGDQEGISIALQGLGDIAVKRGDFGQALTYYQPSLTISETLGDRYNQVQTLLNLGKVYAQQTKPREAQSYWQRALSLAEAINSKRLAQQIHDELSSFYETLTDLRSSLEHLKISYRLEREVFSEDLEAKLESLSLHFEIERAEKEKELYRLKHIELAKAYDDLRNLNQTLEQANTQKEKLLKTLAKQKQQLQHQSTHDALTGLYNRRYFDKELGQAYRRAVRYQHPLSVVLADIDNFKKINDRFSHQIGDEVLKTIAKLLARNSRETDVIARYGGEEFALLLTNTFGEDAAKVCEKICRLVERYPWQKVHPDLTVTLSMGLFDDTKVGAVEEMMSQADKRLYKAKHNGKNQVVLASISESQKVLNATLFMLKLTSWRGRPPRSQ